MKYFFISDVHGEYDKMIEALNLEGFDMEKDTLVSLGDPFDRGPKSKEVLEFIMSCPHHIIVIGNHDWRLRQLVRSPALFNQYDISNGVPATYKSFLGIPQDQSVMAWEALEELSGNELLHQYFEEAVMYVEFKDFIAVHAWVPFNEKTKTVFESYNGDWREASRADWYDAVWAHTELCMLNEIYPEKRLVVGHWHAWRLAEKFAWEQREEPGRKYNCWINCDIYCDEHVIAIDGCTNYPHGGKVNVLTYDTDEKPSTLRYMDCK